ncbi:MAG: methyltransferase domain-containing protein [Candidatus Aenigmarchaeota archaeon]|nr:methyltransferase domain-containing protein [Candidatus Aenigmarchaeota archaeon]
MLCRICKSASLHKFLSLGPIPLVNSLLKTEQLNLPENYFPLDVYFCAGCTLVQLTYVVPPETLFRDYVYLTGTSKTMRQHFGELARDIEQRFGVEGSLVIDIGGNDGTLLHGFRKPRVLNVEPARNIAQISEANGVKSYPEFFSEKTAGDILEKFGKARVIIGTNVFAHCNDIDDFVKGVLVLLEDEGVFVVEFPYLADMISQNEFDTIYHEHLSYFSVSPLVRHFGRYGLEIFDVQRFAVHGGSIRLFVKRKGAPHRSTGALEKILKLENDMKLDAFDTYLAFASRVRAIREKLLAMLRKAKSEGKRVAGYGAPAKGNILLNYCGIGTGLLEYTVDKNEMKQGFFTPGMHIPIYGPGKLMEDKPDYVLLLAWNFGGEIMKQEQGYHLSGGRFIVPIPEPSVV